MNLHVVDVVVQLEDGGVAVGLAVGDGEGVEQQDERAVLGIDGLAGLLHGLLRGQPGGALRHLLAQFGGDGRQARHQVGQPQRGDVLPDEDVAVRLLGHLLQLRPLLDHVLAHVDPVFLEEHHQAVAGLLAGGHVRHAARALHRLLQSQVELVALLVQRRNVLRYQALAGQCVGRIQRLVARAELRQLCSQARRRGVLLGVERGVEPVERALGYAASLCEELHRAHQHGVLHPHNGRVFYLFGYLYHDSFRFLVCTEMLNP